MIEADAAGAQTGSTLAQGGAGGSVRLTSLLVDGAGTINTSGGTDSDGVVRSPAGPAEIQAFVQDMFSGTFVQNGTNRPAPIRGNAPVVPVPGNLPTITINQINSQFVASPTGSLTAPDVTLATPSTGTVAANVSISTQNVPVGTFLNVLAVGTDGSSIASSESSVGPCSECPPGVGFAFATLNLNTGTTYQIVVTPSAAFQSARLNSKPAAFAETPLYSALGNEHSKETSDSISAAERWMKAFGVRRELAGWSAKSDSAKLLGALR